MRGVRTSAGSRKAKGSKPARWMIWLLFAFMVAFLIDVLFAVFVKYEVSNHAVYPQRDKESYPVFGSFLVTNLPVFWRYMVHFLEGSHHAILSAFTIALAVGTGYLAWFTKHLWGSTQQAVIEAKSASDQRAKETNSALTIADRSADAAQRTAKVTEDALLIGERPYIFVTNIRFEEPIDPETFDYNGPEVWPSAIYQLENHGRTPATITAFCYESICAAALPEIPEYRQNRIHDQLRHVWGRGDKGTLDFLFKTPIDGQVLNDIHIGTRELFAYGYVKYGDIFGRVNTVGYCWRYNVNLKQFLPEHNGTYEYRHQEQPSELGAR